MNSEPDLPLITNKDGGYGWVIVFTTFMIHVITTGVMLSFGVFYVEFLVYFQTTAAKASLVMSIFIGVSYCCGPIASGLIDTYGCRVVSVIGTVVACIGLLLSLAVPAIEYLYITVGLISGIGFGLLNLPTIVSVALYFEKKRAIAMGISTAGSGIGSLLFVPLMEWLIRRYHFWKGALLIGTGLVLNCLVFSLFYGQFDVTEPIQAANEDSSSQTPNRSSLWFSFIRRRFFASRATERHNQNESAQETHSANSKSSRKRLTDPGLMQKSDILYGGGSDALLRTSGPELISTATSVSTSEIVTQVPCIGFSSTVKRMVNFSLFRNYKFAIFVIYAFLFCFANKTPSIYLYHRASESGMATKSEASFLLSLIGLSNAVGKLVFGFWVDKTHVSVLNIYVSCLIINGVATMMVSLITHYYVMVIYSLIFGITWGGTISLASILLVRLLGTSKLSNAYGLYLLVSGIAMSFGSPLTGVLYDLTSSYDPGFYLCGGLTVLGGLVLLIIPIIQVKFPQ